MRYVRAFFIASWLTLRGEKPEPRPYAPLLAWMEKTDALVKAVFEAADEHGVGKTTREQIKLTIDGRPRSMQTILAGVAYHVTQEYPYLLENFTEHTITAIYASNLNDQYGVMRLNESDAIEAVPVKSALAALNAHLKAIPPSTSLTP